MPDIASTTGANAGQSVLTVDYSDYDPVKVTESGGGTSISGSNDVNVDPSFVNPPLEQEGRIVAEAKQLAALWTASAASRLWGGPFLQPVPASPSGQLAYITNKATASRGRYRRPNWRQCAARRGGYRDRRRLETPLTGGQELSYL